MFRNKNKRNKQNGATAVEVAIVLPLALIFIFGIIEFSLLLYNKNIINHAAREGARVGVVYSRPDRIDFETIEEAVSKYIENRLISFSPPKNAAVDVPQLCPEGALSEQKLTVSVTYAYSFLVLPGFLERFFSGGLPDGIPVGSEAAMICE